MHKTQDTSKTFILHIDGDNFFVSCELQRFPHLKGKPVIVGEERGIASAMSPEAKKLGITRGMPVFQIRKEYPQVTILPGHFELYDQYNEKMYTILKKYSDVVERYSIDECFALITLPTTTSAHKNTLEDTTEDTVTKDTSDKATAHTLICTIKEDIESSLGITVSIGLASTKTLAKIASKKEKPSGAVSLAYMTTLERDTLLKQTAVGSVWGIGRAISAKLTSYNIHTAFDFINQHKQFIERNFGSHGLDTWYELQGISRMEVHAGKGLERDQQSFQSTKSFGYKTKERSFLLSELCIHAEVLCTKLRQHGLTTNHFSYFIKKAHVGFNRYISKEIEIGFYTNNPTDIYKRIEASFDDVYSDVYEYKTTGITIYKLRPQEMVQDDLFGTQRTITTNNKFLEALDIVSERLSRQGNHHGVPQVHLLGSLQARIKRERIFNERNNKNKFIYGLPLPYMGEVS